MINRADTAGIIPKEHYEEIFRATAEQSVAMQLGTRLRNMKGKEMSITVQDTLPMGGFVNGDAGLKPQSDMKWADKMIVAEEIAVYIPIPDNVLNDARDNGTDLWAEIRPQLSTAFGKVIDNAVLFGTGKPASWRDGIVTEATAKGNTVTKTQDGYIDIMGEDGLIAKVEQSGYMVSGFVGAVGSRAYLRGIRTETNLPLFNPMPDPLTKKTTYTIDGERVEFPLNGVMEGTDKPLLIAGDFKELVYSIREEILFEIFNTGVISDEDGKVILNLMTQDTSVIRAKMRLGWQLPNPVNHIGGENRFPFSVLKRT